MNKERRGNSEANIFVKVVGCCYLLIWKKYISTYCFTLAQRTAKSVAVVPYNEHLQEMHCPFTAVVTNGKITFS